MAITMSPVTTTRGDGRPHVPVLSRETVELLDPAGGGVHVDLTVGLGGHAALMLDAHPERTLLGIDRDPTALAVAAEVLRPYGSRVVLRHAVSDQLGEVLDDEGIAEVRSILADLGVSSPQIDIAARGFSYTRPGPLDMRMDQTTGETAFERLSRISEEELALALRRYADEPHARRIASRIVDAQPRTTDELAEVVREAVPAARRRRGDPARNVFQAIRILVNDEIGGLERTLDVALDRLAPGGRLGIISFHSGEDRLVKHRFRDAATGACTCPPGLPCVCGATPTVRLVTRKAVVASPGEIALNPRSTSARLRVVEALPEPGAS